MTQKLSVYILHKIWYRNMGDLHLNIKIDFLVYDLKSVFLEIQYFNTSKYAL